VKSTLASHLYQFYNELKPPASLPNEVEWLFPQKDPAVMEVVARFLKKYYSDNHPRTLMLGINPGRFGAGITGVNFTAARQLTRHLQIEHSFGTGSELSAEFIYDFIEAYGGPEAFYSTHFIGSVSPLGFVRHGKNLNYYDDPELMKAVQPFIVENLERLLAYGFKREVCICIGGDKNLKQLTALNEKYRWFNKIISLPHPRFIMQYRRKFKEQFITEYLQSIKLNV
jgi:hypothetical protein